MRWLIAIVGATGPYLLAARYGLGILAETRGLGIVIMIAVWSFYTAVIIFEKKLFARIFVDPEEIDMDKTLKMINAMHWVLLTASFSAVAGGVWFAHR